MADSKGSIAVVGNGLMGTGIAQVFAVAGWDVLVVGRDEDRLASAREKIKLCLSQFVERKLIEDAGALAAIARVNTTTSIGDAANRDIVIEAITEDIDLKSELFGELDKICHGDCILATSSGQPASKVIAEVALVGRVIATHFWYPAPLIPIVEVCPSPKTDPDITIRTMDILRSIGRHPVEVKRELPGFIGNRIQFAILREAWALWASGIASAHDIDTVVKKTIGRRLGITGPLESADLGGLDTFHAFAQTLLPSLDTSAEPPIALSNLVSTGARGASNKSGVYDWNTRSPEAIASARLDELFRWAAKDDNDD